MFCTYWFSPVWYKIHVSIYLSLYYINETNKYLAVDGSRMSLACLEFGVGVGRSRGNSRIIDTDWRGLEPTISRWSMVMSVTKTLICRHQCVRDIAQLWGAQVCHAALHTWCWQVFCCSRWFDDLIQVCLWSSVRCRCHNFSFQHGYPIRGKLPWKMSFKTTRKSHINDSNPCWNSPRSGIFAICC